MVKMGRAIKFIQFNPTVSKMRKLALQGYSTNSNFLFSLFFLNRLHSSPKLLKTLTFKWYPSDSKFHQEDLTSYLGAQGF